MIDVKGWEQEKVQSRVAEQKSLREMLNRQSKSIRGTLDMLGMCQFGLITIHLKLFFTTRCNGGQLLRNEDLNRDKTPLRFS